MVKQNIVFVENTQAVFRKLQRFLQRIRSISTVSAALTHRSLQTSVWYATIRKEQMRSWLSMDT